MSRQDGFGRDAGGPRSPIDPETLALAVGAAIPYCDVIKAHLIDIADNNTHAAMATITRLGEIDAVAEGLCDDVSHLAATAAQLRAALPDTGDPDGAGTVVDRLAAATEETAARTALGVRQLWDRGTAAAAEMQFEDVGRQMIMHIVDALDDLREQLICLREYACGEVTPAAVRAGVREVDDLRRRHVMDAQRVAHALATSEQPVTTDAPLIELF